MSEILVIRNKIVFAKHTVDQWDEIQDKYPGCDIVLWNGPSMNINISAENFQPPKDPRTKEQRLEYNRQKIKKSMLNRHTNEQISGIVLSNGMRFGYTDAQLDNYMRQGIRISIVGNLLESVSLWDASGVEHVMTPSGAMQVIAEYAILAGNVRENQLRELGSIGW